VGRHSLEEGAKTIIRKDSSNPKYFVIEYDGEILSIPLSSLDDIIYGLQSFEVTGDSVEIY
jgi:hypothetical protein